MTFDTIEGRMTYFRGLSDYRLMPKTPVIVMLDGRSFSKVIKKRFKRPFDADFINMMNETAKYLCDNVANCKFAYTQSDEISLILIDYENPKGDSFFGYRLCKLQSVIASMAAAKFNQLLALYNLENHPSINPYETISKMKLVEFDCRAWNVPNENEVFAWLLFRQNDCVRNSKAQTAQTWLSHNQLHGLRVDQQISKLENEKGIDWHKFSDGEKFGRFIYKTTEMFHNDERNIDYERSFWKVTDAWSLNNYSGRKLLQELNILTSWVPKEIVEEDVLIKPDK